MQLTNNGRTLGVWIIGACGDIAATVTVGAGALARGLISEAGLTTARPPFDCLALARVEDLCFGGMDIGNTPLEESALALQRRSRTVDREVLDAVMDDIRSIESDITRDAALHWDPAASTHESPELARLVERTREHIGHFRAKHGLQRVIVVNLMSSMPDPAPCSQRDTVAGIEELIETNRKDLITPSVCYAWAALSEGCPYVNFTPNTGTEWGGIAELAARNRLPFCGDDGKTGETLIKTALAHMFAYRNLPVMSWEGINLLGNNDGKTLNDPRNREGKIRHKERVLDGILGYHPHAGVTINYVPSLGDWKTAWDLIHFQGFMDVPMTMQFTWQGCDSILAAPLVLDLIRLTDFAARRGESGPLHHLAAFFKHPLGVSEMDFHYQFKLLLDYVESSGTPATATEAPVTG